MFQINDYVVYGTTGVCKIVDISEQDFGIKGKVYYTMKPIYDKDGTVFVPVDNDKISMRKMISKDEAENIVKNIPTVKLLLIPDEKQREAKYKEAIQSGDCNTWIQILKGLYVRKQENIDKGKKQLISEQRIMKAVERLLYGELAAALEMEPENVEDYIKQVLEN